MKYYTTEAFIIKGIPYGDSGRIYTLFAKGEGKLSAIAKGVKRPKNALNAVMQLGNKVEVVLSRGRNMDIVTQGTILNDYRHIRSNAKAYLYASYLMELLHAATIEREANDELFALTDAVFQRLGTVSPALLARFYEIHLLDILGYRPDFRHCHHCGRELKEAYISPVRQGLTCDQCGGGYLLSAKALYGLQFLQSHGTTEAGRLKLDEETLAAMERATKHLLDFHLERKLRAAAIVKDMDSL